MNLQEEGILVWLSMSMAGVSSRSKTLTREAAEAHEADRDSVRGIVFKLSSDDLKPLQRIVNAARGFLLENTLPWDNNGYRLLPVTRYAHVKRELQRMKNDFEDEVDKLVKRYPTLRKDYIRRVNDLAQEIPFPTLEQLKSNFDFDFNELPIANPDDLRLRHVDPKTVEEIKRKLHAQMDERMEEAHRDIINRLFTVVKRMHEATAKEDGRLFESLVTNIEEAVEVLPKLNMRNDPEINRYITRIRTELSSIDVQALRNDPKERAKTSKLAGSILTDLRNYGKAKPKAQAKAAAKVAPAVTITAPVSAPKSTVKKQFAAVRI